jgi:hypothetical protein
MKKYFYLFGQIIIANIIYFCLFFKVFQFSLEEWCFLKMHMQPSRSSYPPSLVEAIHISSITISLYVKHVLYIINMCFVAKKQNMKQKFVFK